MANPDHPEEHADVREFIARHTAACTWEEKRAVMREYKDHAPVRTFLEQFAGHSRVESIRDLVDEAPTREAKLAILREDYSEEEAQRSLRLIESEPLVKAAPAREEKLALLRAFLPEEQAQHQFRRIVTGEAAAVLREYLPESEAKAVAGTLLQKEDFPAADASERARQTQAHIVGMLLRALPENQVQGAFRRIMDKIDGGGANPADTDYPEILERAEAYHGELNARLATATTPRGKYAAICDYAAEKLAKMASPTFTDENAKPGEDQ